MAKTRTEAASLFQSMHKEIKKAEVETEVVEIPVAPQIQPKEEPTEERITAAPEFVKVEETVSPNPKEDEAQGDKAETRTLAVSIENANFIYMRLESKKHNMSAKDWLVKLIEKDRSENGDDGTIHPEYKKAKAGEKRFNANIPMDLYEYAFTKALLSSAPLSGYIDYLISSHRERA